MPKYKFLVELDGPFDFDFDGSDLEELCHAVCREYFYRQCGWTSPSRVALLDESKNLLSIYNVYLDDEPKFDLVKGELCDTK